MAGWGPGWSGGVGVGAGGVLGVSGGVWGPVGGPGGKKKNFSKIGPIELSNEAKLSGTPPQLDFEVGRSKKKNFFFDPRVTPPKVPDQKIS